MDAFNTFIAEAKAKAEQFGWGANTVSVLPSKMSVRVIATQPIPTDSVMLQFRINEDLVDRDTVIALLNGE